MINKLNISIIYHINHIFMYNYVMHEDQFSIRELCKDEKANQLYNNSICTAEYHQRQECNTK